MEFTLVLAGQSYRCCFHLCQCGTHKSTSPLSLVFVFTSQSLRFAVHTLSACSTASTRMACLNILLLYFTFKAASQSLGIVCHTTAQASIYTAAGAVNVL